MLTAWHFGFSVHWLSAVTQFWAAFPCPHIQAEFSPITAATVTPLSLLKAKMKSVLAASSLESHAFI